MIDWFGVQTRSPRCVHLTANGNLLSAFINGGVNPVTTLDLTGINPGYDYTHGRVGLYSFSGQTFDNVVLTAPQSVPIPELSSGILLALGIGFAVLYLLTGRLRNWE